MEIMFQDKILFQVDHFGVINEMILYFLAAIKTSHSGLAHVRFPSASIIGYQDH
jgi:hypothetical protein